MEVSAFQSIRRQITSRLFIHRLFIDPILFIDFLFNSIPNHWLKIYFKHTLQLTKNSFSLKKCLSQSLTCFIVHCRSLKHKSANLKSSNRLWMNNKTIFETKFEYWFWVWTASFERKKVLQLERIHILWVGFQLLIYFQFHLLLWCACKRTIPTLKSGNFFFKVTTDNHFSHKLSYKGNSSNFNVYSISDLFTRVWTFSCKLVKKRIWASWVEPII
jgi:hypothetical protein